jgi:hypothetical protein
MSGGYIGTAPADRDPAVGNDTVGTSKIQDDAVSTVKVQDDAVTAAKLANSINTEIAANTAKTTNATHTGDVTGAAALTIAADAVTYAKMQDTTTANRVLGAATAGTIGEVQVTGDMIAATTIVNSNINASAAIALSKLDRTADASWTGAQRGTLQVVTDGTLDLNAGNNFKYTPGGADTLEFSNETDGQGGYIILINASGHTISLGSEVKKGASWDVSTAGTYLVSYLSDGTNVYVSNSEALS